MRSNGTTHDNGFINGDVSMHDSFTSDTVQRDMFAIHDDLHCNVVRVLPDRLSQAHDMSLEPKVAFRRVASCYASFH